MRSLLGKSLTVKFVRGERSSEKLGKVVYYCRDPRTQGINESGEHTTVESTINPGFYVQYGSNGARKMANIPVNQKGSRLKLKSDYLEVRLAA